MASRNAQAYPFYIDVQGGGGYYLGTTDPFFNSGLSGRSNLGMDFQFGMFYTPLEPRDGFDIQLGIQTIFFTAPQDPHYYGSLIPYPTLRVQLWMAYASVGVAPLVWRRAEVSPGFDNFSKADSTLAYLAELGALYAATPKFSMGASFSLQYFSTAGVFSAQPAAAINFAMRFYFNLFGVGTDGPGQANPLEYGGWRYIGK